MKKLTEEIQFDPKTCDEIRNHIKEQNIDLPSIESLDLKNPEHLKLLDQLYNPKVLKSILQKTSSAHNQQQQQQENSHKDVKTSSGSHSHHGRRSHEHCSKCKQRSSSHRHHQRSHNDSNGYMDSEKRHSKDYYDYPGSQNAFFNSPLLPKDAAYRFPSPGDHHAIKKEHGFTDYHHPDMMERENDLLARGNSVLGYNPDSYLFGSPMPLKKVKLEDQSPLDFVKRGGSDENEKSKGSDDRLRLGWMNNSGGENHDPNLGHHNMSFSAKKKGGSLGFYNSNSKDPFNVSRLFFSPKPNKYESPSKYFYFFDVKANFFVD